MAKCDTAKNATFYYYEDWCRRCLNDFKDAERGAPRKRCFDCKVVHLKERMFEKLEGWLCRGCAKQYDESLLKKFTSATSA